MGGEKNRLAEGILKAATLRAEAGDGNYVTSIVVSDGVSTEYCLQKCLWAIGMGTYYNPQPFWPLWRKARYKGLLCRGVSRRMEVLLETGYCRLESRGAFGHHQCSVKRPQKGRYIPVAENVDKSQQLPFTPLPSLSIQNASKSISPS